MRFAINGRQPFLNQISNPDVGLDTVIAGINANSSLLHSKDSDGNGLLHYAVMSGQDDKIEFFSRPSITVAKPNGDQVMGFRMPNINCMNNKGQNAAYYLSNLSLESLELLKERGMNFDMKDRYNNSPLHRIIYLNNISVNKEGDTPLYNNAVTNKGLDVVRFVMQHMKDYPHRENAEGITPLHIAAYNRNVEMVNFLCDNGADPNATDWDSLERNYKPIHYVLCRGVPSLGPRPHGVSDKARVNDAMYALVEHGAILDERFSAMYELEMKRKLLVSGKLPAIAEHGNFDGRNVAYSLPVKEFNYQKKPAKSSNRSNDVLEEENTSFLPRLDSQRKTVDKSSKSKAKSGTTESLPSITNPVSSLLKPRHLDHSI